MVVLADSKILLVRSWLAPTKNWGLPGGGLHRNEDPMMGAIREVAEETDVQLQPDQCQFMLKKRAGAYGLSYHCYFFVARLSSLASVSRQHGEIADVQWFEIAELDTVPHYSEIDVLLASLAPKA